MACSTPCFDREHEQNQDQEEGLGRANDSLSCSSFAGASLGSPTGSLEEGEKEAITARAGESTIAAISTPLAPGGISVLRVSGPEAISIAAKVFRPLSRTPVEQMEGNTCLYGKIYGNGVELDEGILTVFRAPKSYTGEDVAELSCHGGVYITRKVLRALLEAGAVPAGPGEFTKRALFHGKMTLTQAEAVMELISCQGEAARRSAVALRDGALYRSISGSSRKLVRLLAALAAWNDYPDEGVPEVQEDHLLESIRGIRASCQKLLDSYENGKIFREGVRTAIVGRPNVGKSTLMNLLAGAEKSIVTDIAGTTRDVVEEAVRLGDVILLLADTAGIRESEDPVEQIGVTRAFRQLETAELVLAVFDSQEGIQREDQILLERLALLPPQVKKVALWNKSDLSPHGMTEKLHAAPAQRQEEKNAEDFQEGSALWEAAGFQETLSLSAKRGEGLDSLQQALERLYLSGCQGTLPGQEAGQDSFLLANERQRQCLFRAKENLREAEETLLNGMTLDLVTIPLEDAASALLELSGEKASDAVIDAVFENFCVGK